MSSGGKALDAFIEGVESLRSLNEDVAKAAEKPVAGVLRESAAAGAAPDGSAWPDKKEGGKALQGAASAIQSRTQGSTIVLSIGAPYAYHNHGAGGHSQTSKAKASRRATAARQAESGTKSKFHAPRRQILPEGDEMPAKIRDEVEAAARKVFAKATEGG